MSDLESVICGCTGVTKGTIVDAINAKNLTTVEQVGEETRAGTVCGSCKLKIQDVLDEVNG